MQAECNELQRMLQTEQNLVQNTQPACALPYTDCIEALNVQQQLLGEWRTFDSR